MMSNDLGLLLGKRMDLIELLRGAERDGRLLWRLADPDFEIEAVAIRTRGTDARVYLGPAPELREVALLPPLCADGAEERVILRAAREAVFGALESESSERATLHRLGIVTGAEFAARTRSLRPSRRADLRALAALAPRPVSAMASAPRGWIGTFTLTALELEAVITRNTAGMPRVQFAITPPLRSVALFASAADTTEAAERDGHRYVRDLLRLERLAGLRRAA
ncbi:hypothetical protein [Polyangium sp. y55x31]|uniref:hypothetical protein n=1 Tax=Polyangium sp. y55x31 TaxID=3042688 RepID=UPI002482D2D5|nr:hypothetical protein [Polyangium sp. y55x31]MDI1475399.1 hypothetical protein [Polyangium sp. y55x31]